jgi:hypothetical protein
MPLHGLAGPKTAVIVASDLHGDIDALTSIGQSTGLISETFDWIGGTKKLVIAGDFVGKSNRSRSMIEVLMLLERQAAQAGGEVISLLGNWEADLLLQNVDRFTTKDLNRFLVSPLGPDPVQELAKVSTLVHWLRTRPAIWEFGNIMISHAGPTKELLSSSPSDINRQIQQALAKREGHALLEGQGPLDRNSRPSEKLLDQLFEKYGWTRYVVGHEPTASKHIELSDHVLGERWVRIDSSISRWSSEGGSTEALLIAHDGSLSIHKSKTVDKVGKGLRKFAVQALCGASLEAILKK